MADPAPPYPIAMPAGLRDLPFDQLPPQFQQRILTVLAQQSSPPPEG